MVLLTEWEQKGRVEGRAEATQNLVLRQLDHKVGPLSAPLTDRLAALALSPEQLETLGEALLDCTTLNDLAAWLDQTTAP
ncbi:MAG: DUF4351 domain-containing protein [Chloroflexales bacterium]|nr:DUF4351 domain-containing protein [Chloroflexales bacterium]